jgi:hypothetical protein
LPSPLRTSRYVADSRCRGCGCVGTHPRKSSRGAGGDRDGSQSYTKDAPIRAKQLRVIRHILHDQHYNNAVIMVLRRTPVILCSSSSSSCLERKGEHIPLASVELTAASDVSARVGRFQLCQRCGEAWEPGVHNERLQVHTSLRPVCLCLCLFLPLPPTWGKNTHTHAWP